MKTIEDIWFDYHSKLSSFIGSRVDHDAAEDILQDVFVKIHTRIDSLKDNAKLESWIYQITRNAVIDYYRSKRPADDLPDWIEQPQPNESETIRRELSSCLLPMIEQLPDKYRTAITLSEVQGKTQTEVAEVANISLSGAKSRVQRGRGLLKSMLHDCCLIELNQHNQLISFEQYAKDCKFCGET
ncbi:MAG: RNA polymerase sigma factor SigZ [Chloroflexota bacterium]